MPKFDKSWTLFLDRDGVINVEKKGGYILSWEEFQFEEGALEALAILNGVFGHIIVVTNQRGVGRGLMSMEALRDIHHRMRLLIQANGGRIDAIYACTDADLNSPCRKPAIGMALEAKKDFPAIQFERSVMVGNSVSDMEFGRKLGMYNIWIVSNQESMSSGLADESWKSLYEWALSLRWM
ncbi:MAG: HAD family hydrolase [Bacteroidia bacterium]|nr:HAD family hydrolase [Bacteroidia bacterium]MDW8134815.1 HAD family hydrolase [Bacteroidia bacterium]